MTHSTRFVVAFLLVIVLIGGWGLTTASAAALPGDALYPVKTGLENLRLTFTNDPAAQQRLQEERETRRQEEVRALLQLGQEADVHFSGILLEKTATTWNVGGLPVTLDSNTEVIGQPTVGTLINVEARTLANGTLVASRLKVAELTDESPVDHPTPEPSHTPQPIHEPTHMPTHQPTHEPTHMPTHQPTHEPTHMPTHQPTHEPTHMPTHQPTHEPTHMPTHQPTHEPTHMPTHQPTHEPTHMPATHQPTHEPTHMPTHQPTHEPTHMPATHEPPHETDHDD